jgi:hypothetical protein
MIWIIDKAFGPGLLNARQFLFKTTRAYLNISLRIFFFCNPPASSTNVAVGPWFYESAWSGLPQETQKFGW